MHSSKPILAFLLISLSSPAWAVQIETFYRVTPTPSDAALSQEARGVTTINSGPTGFTAFEFLEYGSIFSPDPLPVDWTPLSIGGNVTWDHEGDARPALLTNTVASDTYRADMLTEVRVFNQSGAPVTLKFDGGYEFFLFPKGNTGVTEGYEAAGIHVLAESFSATNVLVDEDSRTVDERRDWPEIYNDQLGADLFVTVPTDGYATFTLMAYVEDYQALIIPEPSSFTLIMVAVGLMSHRARRWPCRVCADFLR